MDEWLNALVHLDKPQVERIYEELQGEMKHVLDFEIINYYKLLYTRYLIMKRDFPAVEEELESLKRCTKSIHHSRNYYIRIVKVYIIFYSINIRGHWNT